MSAHAAGVLLTRGNRALFLKRSPTAGDHQGEWCCPGGSIEAGETPDQAARRETQEETMYPAGDLTQIDEGAGFVTFRQNLDEEFEPILNDEHSEFAWADLSDPPKPLHPGMAATLEKLRGQGMDKRDYDAQGWFEVSDNPLSKVGVYKYSGRSIGGDAEPDKLYGVYRSAEELGSPEAVESFRLMPWTDDHPDALLGDPSDGLVPAESKGVHGVIGEQTYFKNGTLYGNIKVFSQSLAQKIAQGKKELSCGYHCKFVKQEGVYEGEPYQYAQVDIRGNHLSSVDHGRMGSAVRVLDAAECFTFALDMKEHATDVAGVSDAEKVTSGQHSINSGVSDMAKDDIKILSGTEGVGSGAGDGDDKDPNKKADQKSDTKTTGNDPAKDARDAARSARDAARARDEMSSEEEEGMDAAECAEDAAEEKEDKDDKSPEAMDRKSARDRRAGARDARAMMRARDAAKDAKDKAAKDAEKDEDKDMKKGMDAAEVAALVDKRVADVIPAMRREAAAKHKLYQRLSPVIGAFDHDEMTLTDMASYGLQKLDAPKADNPVMALDYLLVGRGQAQVTAKPRAALDKSEDSFISRYLNS